MRSRTPAGIPVATINLSGIIRDGHLDASGGFLNGRSASIDWRHN